VTKLVVGLLLWLVLYAVVCWLFPTMRCTRCDGSGRRYQNKRKKSWRPCPRCNKTGERDRPGVKVMKALWKVMK
jgi:hypothetical protein